MKKFYRIAPLLVTLGMLIAATSNANEYQQHDSIIRIADGAPVGAAFTTRTANRVQTILRTTDLDPGSAVTLWWRVYNRPRHCAMPHACTASDLANPDVDGSQLHATAHVVSQSDGSAVIVASLYRTATRAEGGADFDSSLLEGYLHGRGLRQPLGAHVQLVLVSHGRLADPAIDGEHAAVEQLLTPGGSSLDCVNPDIPEPARRFRCGALQIVDIPAAMH